ncbi:tripartite tricarboxylate transporter substrate binding protein [Variibacter gotjawalensis]|uniref:tripartite tricarboxylate transporter substrate binding protein n=1 Tax=Variibacter gotjawalensis TaxID=1333996 RepID=UPI0012FDBCF0|nr:tripartite tricarboxylate transporter substrate binding protein [Variibacter gotjawalensis]NIK50037.1 tripartite-type tricarboxylate transporter receptor subunit TctC [Variibacter gotjawalensis]
MARALAAALSARLGQPFQVVNRAGGGGSLGTASVAHAMPDGYTLFFGATYVLTVLPAMRAVEAAYTSDSLTPICQTVSNAMVLAVRADSPFQTVNDLVEAARSAPGTIKYGHQGIGTIPNLAMEEFLDVSKLKIEAAASRSEGGALSELLAGTVDVAVVVQGTVVGRDVRILGIFTEERHPRFPEVPTIREQGFEVAPVSIGGLMAPAATPREVVTRLAAACEQAAKDPIYVEAARQVGQPDSYFANIATFRHRLNRDIDIKKKLLGRMELAK